MAKDMDMKEPGEGCMCGMWGHHHWGHMVIKLFIVLFIFWAGVQFGELKATVDNYENGGMMSGGFGGHGNIYYGGSPLQGTMMGGYRTSSAVPTGAINLMEVSSTTGR